MADNTLELHLPILERPASLATGYPSHPTATVPDDGIGMEVGMGRTIDQSYEARRRSEAPRLLGADIRAGLANGSMVRGATLRVATGMGLRPVQGDILLPHQVSRVLPPLGRGQAAAAWEVIEHATMDEAGWRAQVVGIRTTGQG